MRCACRQHDSWLFAYILSILYVSYIYIFIYVFVYTVDACDGPTILVSLLTFSAHHVHAAPADKDEAAERAHQYSWIERIWGRLRVKAPVLSEVSLHSDLWLPLAPISEKYRGEGWRHRGIHRVWPRQDGQNDHWLLGRWSLKGILFEAEGLRLLRILRTSKGTNLGQSVWKLYPLVN